MANIANSTEVDNKMEKKLVGLRIELKKGCMENEKQIRTLCNISLAEYQGIVEIKTTERITCNILSKKMGLSPSRGSRIVDGLVRKGYLLRTTNPEDRRSFILSLSNTLNFFTRNSSVRSLSDKTSASYFEIPPPCNSITAIDFFC